MTDQLLNKDVGVSCEMIVKKDGHILLGKRGKIFGEGSWAIPGGHLEKGEKVENCAKRELKEEVGIEPTTINLLGVINDLPNIPGQMRQYIRFIFLVESYSGEITNKEPDKCEGWKWFDLDKLPEPIFVGHAKVLEFFVSNKKDFFVEG